MKLVAARNFANVKSLNLTVKNHQHPGHIHAGARFEIGTAGKAEDLAPEEKEKVLRLFNAGCIVSEDDTKAVARIDAEVKVEEARAAKAAEQAKSHVSTLEQLVTLLSGNAAKAPAAAKA